MSVEAKRSFVLAERLKAASACENEHEFLSLLQTEQARVRDLGETELDQIISERDKSRRGRFNALSWELRTVALSDCHVYPTMGGRPWAIGRVDEVSAMFTRLEPSCSRIWKMKLFASVFSHLPLIVLQESQTLTFDDGSHRAFAMYLAGVRDVQAYVGCQRSSR